MNKFNSTSASEKAAQRRDAITRRDQAAAAQSSAGILLVAHAPRFVAKCVAAYHPIRSEIDPLPLARAIAAHGAMMALPAVTEAGIEFRAWRDGDVLTKNGKLGIAEPEGPEVVPDLILVPLLAFTREGDRLGYGAGHYDRYLAAHPDVRTVGLAFAEQRVATLPLEPHDVRLDAILTPQEYIVTKEGSCASSS